MAPFGVKSIHQWKFGEIWGNSMITHNLAFNQMRTVLLSSILVLVFMLMAPFANAAKTYSKVAKSGKSAKIDTFMGWNDDCSFQTLDISISKRPAHGKASPKVVRSRISQAQVGSAGKCIGKPIRGLAIYYRSKRGYRGSDRFTVRMKVRGQQAVFFHYNINVR